MHNCSVLSVWERATCDSCKLDYQSLNEDIMKCLDAYCNTNLYVSTTFFITQGNM